LGLFLAIAGLPGRDENASVSGRKKASDSTAAIRG